MAVLSSRKQNNKNKKNKKMSRTRFHFQFLPFVVLHLQLHEIVITLNVFYNFTRSWLPRLLSVFFRFYYFIMHGKRCVLEKK